MNYDVVNTKDIDFNEVIAKINSYISTIESIGADVSSASSCLSFSVSQGSVSSDISSITSDYSSMNRSIRSSLMDYAAIGENLANEIGDLESIFTTSELNEFALSMGKGPLDYKTILANKDSPLYQEFMEAVGKYKVRENLKQFGFLDKDIERVINLDVTPTELYNEIYEEYCNGDDSRFKLIVEQVEFNDCYFSREDTSALLELHNAEYKDVCDSIEYVNGEIKLINDIYKNAEYDKKSKTYSYVNSEGKTVIFTEDEMYSLHDSWNYYNDKLKTLTEQKESLEITIKDTKEILDNPDNLDFKYRNMEELDARLAELDTLIGDKKAEDQAAHPGEVRFAVYGSDLHLLERERSFLKSMKSTIEKRRDYYLHYGMYILQPEFAEKSIYDVNDNKYLEETLANADELSPLYNPAIMDDNQMGALFSGIINGQIELKSGPLLYAGYDEKEKQSTYAINFKIRDGEYKALRVFDSQKYDIEDLQKYADYFGDYRFYKYKEMFNYICKTEGYEAGYKFAKTTFGELDSAYVEDLQESDRKLADKYPWLGWFSIFATPVIAVENSIKVNGRRSAGQTIRFSDIYNSGEIWNSRVSSNLSKAGRGWGIAYNILHSISQSMTMFATAYATGGTSLGLLGSTAFYFGLPTANNALYSAKTRGIPDDQALMYAIGVGAIEVMSEYYSASHLLGIEEKYTKAFSNGTIMSFIDNKLTSVNSPIAKKILESPKLRKVAERFLIAGYCMLSQGSVEGEEEYFTVVLDNVWDVCLNGKLSEFDIKSSAYMKAHPGCSEAEASIYALSEIAQDAKEAFDMGFASGSIMGPIFGGSSQQSIVLDQSMVQNQQYNYQNKSDIKTKLVYEFLESRGGNLFNSQILEQAYNGEVKLEGKGYEFYKHYGSVNQNALNQNKLTENEKEELYKFAEERYGMSRSDTDLAMKSINVKAGACTYADMANILYALYDFNEEAFERDMGYPMLKEQKIKVDDHVEAIGYKLNDAQLLLDLYVFTNTTYVAGQDTNTKKINTLFINEGGTYRVNPNYLIRNKWYNSQKVIDTRNQNYVSDNTGMKMYILKNFVESHGDTSLDFDSLDTQNYVFGNTDDSQGVKMQNEEQMRGVLETAIQNGDLVSLGVYGDIGFYNTNSTRTAKYHQLGKKYGHQVTVVGLKEDGVIVRTWGGESYLSYSQFFDSTVKRTPAGNIYILSYGN